MALPCTFGRNTPLATENLLEITDRVGRNTPPVFSRGGSLLPSSYADGGSLLPSSYADGHSPDDVIAF